MTTLPNLTDAALLAAIDAADPVPAAVLDTARAALSLADWRALTVRQPWATGIVGMPGGHGGPKPVENRTRTTNHRGPILIHAGLHYDLDAGSRNWAMCRWLTSGDVLPSKLATGAIIGTAVIEDCHQCDGSCSEWAEPESWHWVLGERRALAEPIPAKGALGLWRPGPDLVAQVLGQSAGVAP